MELKSKTVEEKPTAVTMAVEIPPAELDQETERILAEIQKETELPGFRRGKVPMEMIRERYNHRARTDALEKVVARAAQKILEDPAGSWVGRPRIEELKVEKDGVKFRLHLERLPEIRLKHYTGLSLVKKEDPIQPEEEDRVLQGLRERLARLVESLSPIPGPDDFVVCDYEVETRGLQPKKLGPYPNRLIHLGDADLPDNFRKALLASSIGQTVTVEAEAGGRPALYRIRIRSVKKKRLPEVDDEMAKDLGLENLEQLRRQIREALEKERQEKIRRDLERQALEAVLSAHDFPVPEGLVEERLEAMLQTVREQIQRERPMPDEEWARSLPALRERYRPEAARSVRAALAVRQIALQEKLEATEEETAQRIEELASHDEHPEHREQLRAFWRERADLVRQGITEKKVLDFLISRAKIH